MGVGRVVDTAGAVRLLPATSPGGVGEREVQEFVSCVTGNDETQASEYVRELMGTGVSAESVYLDLLTPTARRLGEYWTGDRCDFVVVTVAVGRLQRVLREVSHLFTLSAAATGEVGSALLSCIPGEQHTLGLFMVAEFFIRDGWGVSIGAPVSTVDLTSIVRTHSYDMVGFSIACDSRVARLKRHIAEVRRCSRNRRVQVLVGGRAIADQPQLASRLGADGAAVDARSAPAMARSLVTAARLVGQ
jgi:methanogenic corrinoid protein MtbC1